MGANGEGATGCECSESGVLVMDNEKNVWNVTSVQIYNPETGEYEDAQAVVKDLKFTFDPFACQPKTPPEGQVTVRLKLGWVRFTVSAIRIIREPVRFFYWLPKTRSCRMRVI